MGEYPRLEGGEGGAFGADRGLADDVSARGVRARQPGDHDPALVFLLVHVATPRVMSAVD